MGPLLVVQIGESSFCHADPGRGRIDFGANLAQ